MNIIRYSIAGAAACLAAVAGVMAQVVLSAPASTAETHDGKPLTELGKGVKLPPIPVPIYSASRKIGYCVMRVEFDGSHTDTQERRIALPRVTNDLYVEFATELLGANADGPAECASRVGKRTDKYVIFEATFYEKISPPQ